MLLTIANLTAAPLTIDYPFNRTLAAAGDPGDSLQLGVGIDDFVEGEDKGNPAYKRLNLLRQEGKVTLTLAALATDTSILEAANTLD